MAAERLLQLGSDKQLVDGLTNVVLNQYRDRESTVIPHEVDKLLATLLRDHTADVWPMVGEAILKDPVLYFRLSLSGGGISFGTSFDNDGGGHILTSSVPDDTLLDWIREHGAHAAGLIGKIAKAFTPGDPPQWTPLVSTIINEFGNSDEVLSEIGSNLFGFGSVGSRVPYYQTRMALLRQLIDHDIAEVRSWARREAERYEEYARRAEIEDQEDEWGIR